MEHFCTMIGCSKTGMIFRPYPGNSQAGNPLLEAAGQAGCVQQAAHKGRSIKANHGADNG